MFKFKDEVKFSEEGLKDWCRETTGKHTDNCRQWRWLVLGFEGECLKVIRLDLNKPRAEVWHPDFFVGQFSLE